MDASSIDPWVGPIDYDRIKDLSSGQWPARTLIVLTYQNDPFYIAPARQVAAKWAAELWQEHCQDRVTWHGRGIHYRLISLPNPPLDIRGGKPYENTERCYLAMGEAFRDARLMGLVPFDRIVDERNDVPVEHLPNYAETDRPASVFVDSDPADVDCDSIDTIDEPAPALIDEPIESLYVLGLSDPPDHIAMPTEIEMPDVPDLDLDVDVDSIAPRPVLRPPRITPPYFHIEIWCEKTTINSVLLEIAHERKLNVITGSGFQSLTGAWRLIERAKRSGRPVRVIEGGRR
jgi:hypothetical protein